MDMGNDVVVGVDGSASSHAAAERAAEEAAAHGVGLRVVHVLTWLTDPVFSGAGLAGSVTEALLDEARRFVDEAVSAARATAPGVDVVGSVVQGDSSRVLAELSRTASLVVVGSRGLGSFSGMLLGSVATHLAAHAHSAVLVLRGTPEPSGPVTVGVDGSPANRGAIAYAFAEASRHRTALVASHVWSEWSAPAAPPRDPSQAYSRKPGERQNEEEALLSEALSGWRERYPDVRVEQHTVRGRTRESLIDASKGARVLVVGARGLGGFTGMLLGSVSQAALHHAHCPVVVVPQYDSR